MAGRYLSRKEFEKRWNEKHGGDEMEKEDSQKQEQQDDAVVKEVNELKKKNERLEKKIQDLENQLKERSISTDSPIYPEESPLEPHEGQPKIHVESPEYVLVKEIVERGKLTEHENFPDDKEEVIKKLLHQVFVPGQNGGYDGPNGSLDTIADFIGAITYLRNAYRLEVVTSPREDLDKHNGVIVDIRPKEGFFQRSTEFYGIVKVEKTDDWGNHDGVDTYETDAHKTKIEAAHAIGRLIDKKNLVRFIPAR